MRVAIAYPPLQSEKGVALLTQNRQFQWFSHPTYIFPVVPATAATMLKRAGHEVLFLDGIAAGMTPGEFDARLAAFRPDLVVVETKTPVVKRHWAWVEERAAGKYVFVWTVNEEETMQQLVSLNVDAILTNSPGRCQYVIDEYGSSDMNVLRRIQSALSFL